MHAVLLGACFFIRCKAISNKATQTQNAACTVYLGNQKPLQQKTQRGYAFCAPAAPKRKKASSLNDDANLWRARSGGPRSVERPAARRAAWSGRPLLLPGRRAVASPSTSLIDSAALDGAVSSARRGAGRGEEQGGAWVRPAWRGAAGPRRRSRWSPCSPEEPRGACARRRCRRRLCGSSPARPCRPQACGHRRRS